MTTSRLAGQDARRTGARAPRSAPSAQRRAEQARAGRLVRGSFLHNLWAANTVTVTVLADRAGAWSSARVLIIVSDPEVLATFSYFFARPADALDRELGRWSARRTPNLFKGVDRRPGGGQRLVQRHRHLAAGVLPDLGDAHLRRAAGLHRPVGGARRSAAACSTSAPRARRSSASIAGRAGRLPAAAAAGAAPARRAARRRARRRALGLHPGHPQGADRRPRGDHHDHAQLHRALLPDLASCQNGVQDPDRTDAISSRSTPPRSCPGCSATTLRVHLGIVLAVLATAAVAWLLNRSTFGFELRAVGANPDAARTAGISVAGTYALVMVAGRCAGRARRRARMVLGTAPTP